MKKYVQMDDLGNRQKIESDTREEDPYKYFQGNIVNASNVLFTTRIRRVIQVGDGFDWFVLGCRYNFLWHFRIFLVILYLAYEIIK